VGLELFDVDTGVAERRAAFEIRARSSYEQHLAGRGHFHECGDPPIPSGLHGAF